MTHGTVTLQRCSKSYEGSFAYGLRMGVELYEIEYPIVPQ